MLLRLREICKGLEIPIVIPMVALNEWMANRKSDFIKKAKIYETATENMTTLKEKYLIDIELPSFDSPIFPKDKEAICNEIETMLISRLKEIGVSIAETPNVALNLLLKMSINKIRPFEEKGEKGFRDSIILFTVLEYAKKLPGGFHLLITNDSAYDHDVPFLHSQHMMCYLMRELFNNLNFFVFILKRQRCSISLIHDGSLRR